MLQTKELIADCRGYGQVLRAWQGMLQIEMAPGAPAHPGAMPLTDAQKFTSSVYALVRTGRQLTVYRFYETSNLQAPYGKDHKSFVSGQVKNRVPDTKDLWSLP